MSGITFHDPLCPVLAASVSALAPARSDPAKAFPILDRHDPGNAGHVTGFSDSTETDVTSHGNRVSRVSLSLQLNLSVGTTHCPGQAAAHKRKQSRHDTQRVSLNYSLSLRLQQKFCKLCLVV